MCCSRCTNRYERPLSRQLRQHLRPGRDIGRQAALREVADRHVARQHALPRSAPHLRGVRPQPWSPHVDRMKHVRAAAQGARHGAVGREQADVHVPC